MERGFRSFVGVDLGGGKGKTTAVARLHSGDAGLEVLEVGTAAPSRDPWYDDSLIDYLGSLRGPPVVPIDPPPTLPACVRCREPVCPGMSECVDPAIVWFRTAGAALIEE